MSAVSSPTSMALAFGEPPEVDEPEVVEFPAVAGDVFFCVEWLDTTSESFALWTPMFVFAVEGEFWAVFCVVLLQPIKRKPAKIKIDIFFIIFYLGNSFFRELRAKESERIFLPENS